MSVLTDLKDRDIEYILIAATNKLNGFTSIIKTVLPQFQTQICIVNQIKHSCKDVVWKDKYPYAIKSWQEN